MLEKEAKLEEENRALKEKQDKANRLIEEMNADIPVVSKLETGETKIKFISESEDKKNDFCFVDAFGGESKLEHEDPTLDNIEIKPRELEYYVKLTKSEIEIISEFLTDAMQEYCLDPFSQEYENILCKFKKATKMEEVL